ncbi:Tn3 family transposase [Streptomyces sp. NPDC096354]|uniref:Tn3 family transposase n=1 Tax=Streptomyces sp. NPDC096354 TaxID=3366088 RepID=UPI00381653D6
MIFHNALDIAEIVRQLQAEGVETDPEDLAHVSPYLTEHIRSFGEYSTHELGDEPEAYDPRLDIDFTPLRGASRRLLTGRVSPVFATARARCSGPARPPCSVTSAPAGRLGLR